MPTRFNRTLYAQLPEGFPAQLVEGHLVRDPAPTYGHQRLASRLHVRLAALVGADRALTAPVDVAVDEFNVYQPDLLVLEVTPEPGRRDVGLLLLVLEILSPSTRVRDRGVKRKRLLDAGVREVWIVDPDAREVEVWDADGVCRAHGVTTLASRALPGFRVQPAELFGPRG